LGTDPKVIGEDTLLTMLTITVINDATSKKDLKRRSLELDVILHEPLSSPSR
jgi:hypothetical protein